MATDNKPKSAATNSKKRKQYLPHNKPVKKKGLYPLRPGVQGFFITCDGGRERQASHEAIIVIDSFYEELVNANGTTAKVAELPNKPLNKKIKFVYSDDEEEDDDNGVEGEKVEGEKEQREEQNKLDAAQNNDDKGVEGEGVEGEEEQREERNESDTSRNNDDKGVEGERVEGEVEQREDRNKSDTTRNNDDKGVEGDKLEDKEEQREEQNKLDTTQKKDTKSDEPAGESLLSNEEKSCHGNGKEENTNDNEAVRKDIEHQTNEADEPPAKKQCIETCVSNSVAKVKAEQKSIDKLIEDELKELGDKSKRRFANLDSGCNGVVFVQMRKRDGDPSPKEIVQHMMTSTASTRKHMSRFMLRVLPVEVSCYASEEEISKAMAPIVEKYFPADAQSPLKFAVLYEVRANSGIDKMKIINSVAKSVPGPHRVDLSNPDKTIIVQVVKTVCLIGLVEKYKELAKYNLRQLTSPK